MQITGVLLTALAASLISAHPGHDIRAELLERQAALSQNTRRDLSHCKSKLKARGGTDHQIARRHELARSARLARGLAKRADSDINKSHASDANYTYWTDPAAIFADNSSCVLSPEVIPGPYWVEGEYVRSHIVEDQQGIPMIIDAQVLDFETCEPVSGKYVELWHANATGVYSGIHSDTNGDGSSTLDQTFLRGIQQTDADGIISFTSIFPGHYTRRATHIHVFVHNNATMLPNGTIQSEYGYHVGQMFLDQDLISQVEATYPYTTNTQDLWLNSEDDILAVELADTDPLMEYVLLGDSIEDGVLAWLSFGINTTNSHWVSPAAAYYADGGVSLSYDGTTDICQTPCTISAS